MFMFDPNKVADMIDEIYHITNIQYSLVVFDEDDRTSEHFKQLVQNLEARDFPYIVYGSDTQWQVDVFNEHTITKRMFLVPYQYLGKFIEIWRANFESINFLIWLSRDAKTVFDTMVVYHGLKLSDNCVRLVIGE